MVDFRSTDGRPRQRPHTITHNPYLFTPKIQPLTAPHFPSTRFPLHPPATMRIERGNFPMSTERQIAANRINAQKSTGPITPEGRAAVRLNGIKHGLTAQTLVLKGESESDFTALLDSYEAEHEPATPTEEALVLQLPMASWRLRRLYHAEAGYYTYKLKDTADQAARPRLGESAHLGLVTDCIQSTLATFTRQEARLERTFYRALHELQRLRTLRHPPLALDSQQPVGHVPDLPCKKINNIATADPIATPANQPPDTE